MSLATRCTSCKTVFRVVQDQLKVSEGWVRCGRCGTVFNALEALFDLEKDTPARWQSSKPGAVAGKRTRAPGEPTSYARRRSDPPPPRSEPESRPPPQPAPPPQPSAPSRPDFADAQFDPDLVAHVPPPDPEVTEPLPLRPLPQAAPTPPAAAAPAAGDTDTVIAGTEAMHPDADADHTPATLEFVLAAERQARWRDPRTLAIMGGASAALCLVLLLQVMNHYRDITAARWPSMAPTLVRWCQVLQCQLQAPRRIDNVVLENSKLTRSANSANTIVLSVTVRNQGAFAVAMPALDLYLRDANDQIITRRLLTPESLEARVRALEPDTETQVRLQLTEGTQRIENYSVEAFYP